ncbi:hypothetical protein EBU71_05985 [bacterium]|nr:hypothetical protein [Candidatus Elulimicrobium humile]
MNLNIFNKEEKQPEQSFMYTEDQLMARLRFFIGICLALTLFGIVFVVLYSLIFVTQPLNAISPIDQKFFELIVPIATFLTGTLSGIMLAGGDKESQKIALQAATAKTTVSPAPTTPSTPSFPSTSFGGNTSQSTSSFGGNMNQFTATPTAAPFVASVTTGFGGKPAPVQPPQPEL